MYRVGRIERINCSVRVRNRNVWGHNKYPRTRCVRKHWSLRANKQRAYVRLRRMLLHKLCQKWIGDKRPEPETKKKCVPCSDKHVMADAADTS